MEEFISTPWVITVGWIFGVIGWIVGIIAGYIQFKSYSEQRALEAGYLAILEQAKTDWVGKYTEEQLAVLSEELTALEERIQRDIPKEARRLFLTSQLHDLRSNITQSYIDYERLSQELQLSEADNPLDAELKESIERSIMPEYVHRKDELRGLKRLIGIAVFILLFLSWDAIMNAIAYFDNELKVNSYRTSEYPASWILVAFTFIIGIAWILHRSIIGERLDVLVNTLPIKLLQLTDSKTGIAKAVYKAGFWLLVIIVLLTVLLLVMLLPLFYVDYVNGIVDPYYLGQIRPMPLSTAPVTALFALPFSLVVLTVFYSIGRPFLIELRRKLNVRRTRS